MDFMNTIIERSVNWENANIKITSVSPTLVDKAKS